MHLCLGNATQLLSFLMDLWGLGLLCGGHPRGPQSYLGCRPAVVERIQRLGSSAQYGHSRSYLDLLRHI